MRYTSSNPTEKPVDLLRIMSVTDKEMVCEQLEIPNLPETEITPQNVVIKEDLTVYDTEENYINTHLVIVKQENPESEVINCYIITQLFFTHCLLAPEQKKLFFVNLMKKSYFESNKNTIAAGTDVFLS